MKSLQRARRYGRILRAKVGLSTEGLLDRLIAYSWEQYRVQPRPATKAKLRGSRAELRGRSIFYDKDLTPEELLFVLAHELAHLVLHEWRLRRLHSLDPIRAASYLVHEKGPALSRYSPKTREEMEAAAFAVEFLCPSDLAFERWRCREGATSATLAEEFGIDVGVVRAQLVEALYQAVTGRARRAAALGAKSSFEPDQAQWETIQHEGGPALVDAGAGTGKTATLIERVAYLLRREVKALQRPASEVANRFLILTFSNEATSELFARLETRIGEEAVAEMTVATFHGFGYEFLHCHRHLLGLPTELRVLDDAAQEECIRRVLNEACQPILRLSDPYQTVAEAARHINYLKQRLAEGGDGPQPWTPALLRAWLDKSEGMPVEMLKRAYAFCALFDAYEQAKREEGAVDFADLISLPIQLLRNRPDVAKLYHDAFRYVLVDEFQDVSRAVALLLSLLTSPNSPPWVVGDARQAIYLFQGAAPENVTGFRQHFPDAAIYTLDRNYRSCAEVVAAANQLATLMQHPDGDVQEAETLWTSYADEEVLEQPAVRVVVGNADEAERAGIAKQVVRWIEAGVEPHDIAVLARRNVDVLNIVLALRDRGIRAVAPGIVTAEGAAGDLAAVTTVADDPHASLPRLIYALGRFSHDAASLDGMIARLRPLIQADGTVQVENLEADEPDVLFEVVRVMERLRTERYSADAFSMMTAFLFDASTYLRRLLGAWGSAPDADTDIAVQLREVVATLELSQTLTALSRAAADRFSRWESQPRKARRRFADHFRRTLGDATPTSLPPQQVEGAVQVMTCHAAKGLQFPCVIVASQTLSRMSNTYEWLPDDLQPGKGEDTDQADALLFVGVTRAQRAVIVSYAETAGGGTRARQLKPTPLLKHWIDTFEVSVNRWPEYEPVRLAASFDSVWGLPPRARISARTLDPSWCSIRVYIEDLLRLGLPEGEPSLYPRFFEAVRKAMSFVVGEAQRRGESISPDEAEVSFLRAWQTYDVDEHPHQALYYAVGRDHVRRFSDIYKPDGFGYRPLERERVKRLEQPNIGLRLSLVAMFYNAGDLPVAILYRPESYADKLAKDDTINWSTLSTGRRMPFVLLREAFPSLIPYVFSGADGRLHLFSWSRRGDSMEKQYGKATARLQQLSQGRYEEEISEWSCDRCSARISCPYWLRTTM